MTEVAVSGCKCTEVQLWKSVVHFQKVNGPYTPRFSRGNDWERTGTYKWLNFADVLLSRMWGLEVRYQWVCDISASLEMSHPPLLLFTIYHPPLLTQLGSIKRLLILFTKSLYIECSKCSDVDVLKFMWGAVGIRGLRSGACKKGKYILMTGQDWQPLVVPPWNNTRNWPIHILSHSFDTQWGGNHRSFFPLEYLHGHGKVSGRIHLGSG